MTFPKEFKEAISQLPSAEKDKLILRLLKKDLALVNRLLFELVSDKTVDEQRQVVKKELSRLINKTVDRYYSIGYLNVDVREMSGLITDHVYTTKDKFGEASLNLYMISEVLERHKDNIISTKARVKAPKFCTAVIARVYKILILIKKLHPDYFMEFKDDLHKLGQTIGDNPMLMKFAIHNGLDVNWLISGEIPDEIEQTVKYLRANGFLR